MDPRNCEIFYASYQLSQYEIDEDLFTYDRSQIIPSDKITEKAPCPIQKWSSISQTASYAAKDAMEILSYAISIFSRAKW